MGMVIGLLGGVAAGKSTVAAFMAKAGLTILNADEEARSAVAEPEVQQALIQRFGEEILTDEKNIDRERLASLAFSSEEATHDLNRIVHPFVRTRLEEKLRDYGDKPVVLDVPLLLESPLSKIVTVWIYVDTPENLRDDRAAQRGWAAGERARREAQQASLDEKKIRAEQMLDNSGSIEDLEAQVEALLHQLGLA